MYICFIYATPKTPQTIGNTRKPCKHSVCKVLHIGGVREI